MRRVAVTGVAAFSVLAATEAAFAQAECRFRAMSRPDAINNVDGAWQVQLPAGQTSCQATFPAGGRGDYRTTSVNLASQARSGTVNVSSNGFRYSASPNFQGSDSFVIKICGSSRAGQGCANVTYNVVKG